jgi:hypothetical protein
MSDKISNYKRHMSAKHPVENISECKNVQFSGANVQKPGENVQLSGANVQLSGENVQSSKDSILLPYQCSKCEKFYKNNRYLNIHELKCNGVANSLQCYKCNEIFNNRSTKCMHIKKCTAVPLTCVTVPEATPTTTSQVAHTINNNNTVNNINPNYNINIITYNNENILFNSEGICTKDLKNIFNGANKQMIEAIVLYGNKLLEQPENRCVRKKHITSSYCETYAGDGKWETRPDTNVINRFSQDIAISANDRLYDHPTIGTKKVRDEIAELASFPDDVHSKAINLRREIRAMLVNTSSNDGNKN